MKTRKKTIYDALPIVAAAYGEKFGVKVRVGGDTAYTNGEMINIPSVSDAFGNMDVIWGYLAHEAAHVRFTEFVDRPQNLYGDLLNILEDTRIEREMTRVYPGTFSTLNAVAEYMAAQGHYAMLSANDHPARIVAGHCLYYLQYRYMEQKVLEPFLQSSFNALSNVLPSPTISVLTSILDKVPSTRSTVEIVALVKEIIELLKETAQEESQSPSNSQDQDDSSQSDSQGSNDNQGQSSDKGQGESQNPSSGQDQDDSSQSDSQGSNDNQDQSSDKGQGESQNPSSGQDQDDSSQSDSQGSNDNQDQDSNANQDQGDGNQSNSQGSNESQGQDSSNSQRSSANQDGSSKATAIEAALNATGDDLQGDVRDKLKADLNALNEPQANSEYKTPLEAREAKDCISPNGFLLQQVASEITRIRQQLYGLVQAKNHTAKRNERRGKRIDSTRISRIVSGDYRVFNRSSDRVQPNTAIHVLVDMSSSMSAKARSGKSRAYVAQESALAIALALESINGINVAVTYFSNDETNPVTSIVKHGEKVKSKAHYFTLGPTGHTPLAEGLWYSAYQLSKTRQNRKIVLVITDGEPTKPEAAHEVIQLCGDSNIELMGIGINSASVHRYFSNSISIEDVSELRTTLFSLMESMLVAA